MFFLKKFVSRFLFPVPLCAFLFLTGLGLVLGTKRQRTGRVLIGLGTVLLLAFGYPVLPDYLVGRLERTYPALARPEWSGEGTPWVCVLGQGLYADADRPANSRMNETAVSRWVEGARLYRELPGATLLVSVAGTEVSMEEKRAVLHAFFGWFGIATNRVQLVANARDTDDEIREFKSIVGTNRVFLVTSASHLPRGVAIARKHDLPIIPAPCGYLVGPPSATMTAEDLFPNAANLRNSERAIYEYLGLFWETIKGN